VSKIWIYLLDYTSTCATNYDYRFKVYIVTWHLTQIEPLSNKTITQFSSVCMDIHYNCVALH